MVGPANANQAIYQSTPSLYECDHQASGFRWIDHTNAEQSIVSLLRRNQSNTEQVVAIGNFTPIPRDEFRVGVEKAGNYSLIINTDDKQFGGSEYLGSESIAVKSENVAWNDCQYSIVLNLPPLSLIMLKWNKS